MPLLRLVFFLFHIFRYRFDVKDRYPCSNCLCFIYLLFLTSICLFRVSWVWFTVAVAMKLLQHWIGNAGRTLITRWRSSSLYRFQKRSDHRHEDTFIQFSSRIGLQTHTHLTSGRLIRVLLWPMLMLMLMLMTQLCSLLHCWKNKPPHQVLTFFYRLGSCFLIEKKHTSRFCRQTWAEKQIWRVCCRAASRRTSPGLFVWRASDSNKW